MVSIVKSSTHVQMVLMVSYVSMEVLLLVLLSAHVSVLLVSLALIVKYAPLDSINHLAKMEELLYLMLTINSSASVIVLWDMKVTIARH